ncbi:hypothetical protein BKA70DRAFT_1115320 [Coprinopsis sp. MPI-PUGE-AT-0042]|nr:hypothetical protein BKA70DRAFT_1115320 [Coprinopsis sp. MPI-PUGE-AT-0042]
MTKPDSVLSRCNICQSLGSEDKPLSRCGGCKMVRYCSQNHQSVDWPSHKGACVQIKKARKIMDEEEAKLRDTSGPPDPWGWGNPFETSVGHFWGIITTRDYMRARVQLVYKQLDVHTRDSTQSCLDHLLDMLRLCRGDNIGVRDIVPGLFLRLRRDQDAYDFMKWYATEGTSSTYDWGDMSLPFLNLSNEDVMEPVDDLFVSTYGFAHPIAVLLLKLRMLLDLKDLAASTILFQNDKINFDVAEKICNTVTTRSSVWTTRNELLALDGIGYRIALLERQVAKLFDSIHKGNKHFWKGLMDHERWIHHLVEYTTGGSAEEMAVLVQHNARSWIETEGALEWLQKKAVSL